MNREELEEKLIDIKSKAYRESVFQVRSMLEIMDWHQQKIKEHIDNIMQPPYLIELPDDMSDYQMNEFVKRWNKRRAGEDIFVKGKVTVKPIKDKDKLAPSGKSKIPHIDEVKAEDYYTS